MQKLIKASEFFSEYMALLVIFVAAVALLLPWSRTFEVDVDFDLKEN